MSNASNKTLAHSQFILLGASNLTRGFPRIIRLIESQNLNAVHIHSALGHGRSYGKRSQVVIRHLPSIVDSQIWDSLNSGPNPQSTRAIITDVGNDLIYGFSVEKIIEWIDICLARLCELQADIVAASLPMQRIRNVTRRQFEIVRWLFFPRLRTGWVDIKNQAEHLDTALRELFDRYGATVVEPELKWYGFDPIHVRRSMEQQAWNTIMSAWKGWSSPENVSHPGWAERWRFLTTVPADRHFLGIHQQRQQPCWQRKRSNISLY